MKITIIIRTKDRPLLLGQALKSINQAQIPNVEVVVVNDAGVDVENVVKASLDNEIPYTYLSLEKHHGRSEAGNIGAEASRGRHIFFLDDDDLLALDFISLVNQFDGEHASEENLVLYGKVEASFCDQDGSIKETYRIFGRDFDPIDLLWDNFIPFNAAIIPRQLFKEVGGLDSRLKVFEDWDLFLRMSEIARFVYHPVVVAHYRLYENAFILGGNLQLQYDCRIRIFEKHWKKYTPRSLAMVYNRIMRELRNELLPEASRFAAERKEWLEMDQKRKIFIEDLTDQISKKDGYILELTDEISKKATYIEELAQEIGRKGEYIAELENQQMEWQKMDSDRIDFIRALEHTIRNLQGLLNRDEKAS